MTVITGFGTREALMNTVNTIPYIDCEDNLNWIDVDTLWRLLVEQVEIFISARHHELASQQAYAALYAALIVAEREAGAAVVTSASELGALHERITTLEQQKKDAYKKWQCDLAAMRTSRIAIDGMLSKLPNAWLVLNTSVGTVRVRHGEVVLGVQEEAAVAEQFAGREELQRS